MKFSDIRIPSYLRNKYILGFAAYMIWLGFFDENNLMYKRKLSKRIDELTQQKEHYETEIEQNIRKLKEIEESDQSLEKFAREEYLMKKKDEDIFVIIEK